MGKCDRSVDGPCQREGYNEEQLIIHAAATIKGISV